MQKKFTKKTTERKPLKTEVMEKKRPGAIVSPKNEALLKEQGKLIRMLSDTRASGNYRTPGIKKRLDEISVELAKV